VVLWDRHHVVRDEWVHGQQRGEEQLVLRLLLLIESVDLVDLHLLHLHVLVLRDIVRHVLGYIL
jgi:hypothetical protein